MRKNLQSGFFLLIAMLTGLAGRANAETVTTIQGVIDANGSIVTLDMGTNRFQVLYFGTGDENYLWDGERGYMFYRNGCDWSALVGAEPGTYINGSWDVQWEMSYSDIAINGEVNITKGDKAGLNYIECTGAEAAAKYDFTCVKIDGSYDAVSNQFTAADGTVFTVNDNWHDGQPARPAASAEGTIKALKNGTTLIPLEEGYFEGGTANVLSAMKGLADGASVTVGFPAGTVQYVAGGEYTYLWDGMTGVRFYGLSLPGAQAGSYVEGTIGGSYVASYNDIENFTENTLTVGEVAPLKPMPMTGEELTKADGSNLYAYVELTGNYTGYSFTTTDGVTFTVQNSLGIMDSPAGSGNGKIQALYLGDTNNGSVAVGGNNLLQPIVADCFTAEGDVPGPQEAEEGTLAWLKAQPLGNVEMTLKENTVQMVYADANQVALWDGSDGILIYWYGEMANTPFATATPGQYVNGTICINYDPNSLYHGNMGYDGNRLDVTLGEVAPLVPVEKTISELGSYQYTTAHDWDYVTLRNVAVYDGAVCQGEDVLSFQDFLNTGLKISDYEGKTGHMTGLFGGAWGASFYPAAADFFEVTGDAPVREFIFDATATNLDIPSAARANVVINNLELANDRLSIISLPVDLTASQIDETFGEGTKLYAMTDARENEAKDKLTFVFESAETLEHYVPYLILPANSVSTLRIEDTALYDYGNSNQGFLYDESAWSNACEFKATVKAQDYEAIWGATYYWNIYLLIDADNKAVQVTDNRSAQAFSGYWQLNADHFGGNAPEVEIELDGMVTTGIGDIGHSTLAIGHYYDLQGRAIKNGQRSMVNGQLKKGIYVEDGKKVLVQGRR
ncbi:MAG: hypothetical protein IJV24_03870 [Prevotella sp.]|nr:hypothetical protein [Prevotella sp.]